MIDQILSYIITIVTRIRKQTLSQSAKVFDVGSGHFSLANLFRDLKTSFKIIRDHAVTRINFGFFELRRKFVLFSMKSNKTQMRNTIPKINDCAEGNKSNIHFFFAYFQFSVQNMQEKHISSKFDVLICRFRSLKYRHTDGIFNESENRIRLQALTIETKTHLPNILSLYLLKDYEIKGNYSFRESN